MSRTAEWIEEWIAAGLGAGWLPAAPGTWGSLEVVAAGFLGYLFWPASTSAMLGILLILSVTLGVYTAGRMVRRGDDPDPSRVVIDEIAGQSLTLLWVPVTPLSLAAGFILFRCFDILKPPPLRTVERLPGGWGIMADDLAAGLYAGIVLWAARVLALASGVEF